MTYDVAALRRQEFPWADRGDVVYLNHAGTGPLPRRTVEATDRFNRLRAEPHRITFDDETATLSRARDGVARMIGASPEEIALAVNTSFGINLAARASRLGSGDVVVIPDREFPANVYPWMALERDGVRVERVPLPGDCSPEEALLDVVDRERARVLAVSWVSFTSGARLDLQLLGTACRERSVMFVVDAMQGVGVVPLDVTNTPIDVLACGGQKWLHGPWGSGFVYVRRELVLELEPVTVGWRATRGSKNLSSLVDYDMTWLEDARRFELATLPFQDMLGLAESVDMIHELGIDSVHAHVQSLADAIVDWAARCGDVELVTPRDRERRGGVVTIRPRVGTVAISQQLRNRGVIHGLREDALRFSPGPHNTADDVSRAMEALESALTHASSV